jgi:hypothetical protein
VPRCAHEACGRWRPDWMSRRAVRFAGAWFCTEACLRHDASACLRALEPDTPPPSPAARFRLGTLLLADKIIAPDVLTRALERQQASGLRLGAELLAMGAVEPDVLTQVLARQVGVPCVTGLKATQVGRIVAGLSPSVVATLGIVPFALEGGGVLRVAIAAPLPRMAIRVLHRMTGLTVEPYLVPDHTLVALTAAYGGESSGDRGACPISLDEAAVRIAAAARAGRADDWRYVPADWFTWVRLDGAQGSDDIFITSSKGDESWQAASTRH